ncbi:LexA family protein [Streptomyces sp. CS-7]|uniref:LexA family protein n=1 Tax=Streptomyces sp. CS-7 TaxID=2906769 RepID=UPI0037D9E144
MGAATHTFPADLIHAQQQWHATYRALAAPRPRAAPPPAPPVRPDPLASVLDHPCGPYACGPGGAPAADHRRPEAGRGVRRDRALSVRQEAITRLIRSWITEHGEGPTIRQIGASVGLSSTSSVAYQLPQLEKRGLISRTGRDWSSRQLKPPKPPRRGLRSR